MCDDDEGRSSSRQTRTRPGSRDENELNYVAPLAGGTAGRQSLILSFFNYTRFYLWLYLLYCGGGPRRRISSFVEEDSSSRLSG